MTDISVQEAKQLAEEAYIFAFSMLENYKTMYFWMASGSHRQSSKSVETDPL